jgi:hypothetical protein
LQKFYYIDPEFGLPWKKVGGFMCCKTGSIGVMIDTEINPLMFPYGLFYYNEIYPSDPRYNDFLIEGLHQQLL